MELAIDTLKTPPTGGACMGHPTEWWFPNHSVGMKSEELREHREMIAQAINICEECPIAKKCLDYSIPNEPFGIWGGKTEQERASIRYKMRIALVSPEKVYTPEVKRGFFASEANMAKLRQKDIANQRGSRVNSLNVN